MKSLRKMLPALLILTPLLFSPAAAEEFSASFKGTDIQEFINTVSKNLNKTVIIDPSVRGTITVRSYDMLNEEQYYQFFLSVLDVYGFAVINMNNGVLKVVRAKDAKTSAVPVASAAARAKAMKWSPGGAPDQRRRPRSRPAAPPAER